MYEESAAVAIGCTFSADTAGFRNAIAKRITKVKRYLIIINF
jgi:hypothetical protein